MKVSWKINMIISAAATVAAFLAADRMLGYKWWVDTIIALILGGIVNQFILEDKKEDNEIEVVPGLTRKELKDILAAGRSWQEKFSVKARELETGHGKTAGEIREIADVVVILFKNFETDPRDLTTTDAHRLIHDHLPRAFRFVDAYARLATAGRLTGNEQEKLLAMEAKIKTIRDSFSRHLEGFRNNDFTSLEVEGETLETIYKLDI
ncbi:MAG: 5-bromo-4-chloroindolyl phosphate hydrolysis family protein [Pseudomonadota bacterium]